MKSSVRSPAVRTGALRRFVAGLLVAFALVGCAAVGAADEVSKPSAAATRMSDPLLGLSYDIDTVGFERLPDAIARRADLGVPPQWIYARSKSGAITYYIVSGFQRIESDDPDRPGHSIEPDFGAVLRQSGDTVEVLGVPDLLFDQPPLVPAGQRDALLADAVRRYVKAWGREALQAQVSAVRADAVPQALRDALRAQGITAGGR